MSRSEQIRDPGLVINDRVAFSPAPRRRHVTGTVVWVDRGRGTVEVIDREGREHVRRFTEVRRVEQ